MTESSEDKTKRRFVNLMLNYHWAYQYSIFYDNPSNSIHLLEDMKQFKQLLRRGLSEQQPILLRICLLNKNRVTQAYLNILTTARDDEAVEKATIKAFQCTTNLRRRKRSREKIDRSAATIKRERAHNLIRFFGSEKINRFSLLNKQYLRLRITSCNTQNPY